MKVPEIIHYCWFGPKSIPKTELECIESWKIFFPDHKIMFWNEKTFDFSDNCFASEAYEKKQYV